MPPAVPQPPIGFLDALRDGVVVGWARDPADPAAVATIRVTRGTELLAEGPAELKREDGLPGFRLRLAAPVPPADLLEGRVRVRAHLPGRPAPVTLAMTATMRAALEAAPAPEPPPPAAPEPSLPQSPSAANPSEPSPAGIPAPAPTRSAGPRTAQPDLPAPLRPLLALAEAAEATRTPLLHLVLPDRDALLATSPRFDALEDAAARTPLLARDWLPLRHAFARAPRPAAFWRADGRLSVEGCEAALRLLLAALRLRLPAHAAGLDRAARILDRADLAARPRRPATPSDSAAAAVATFLGTAPPQTEPALDEAIFSGLPAPRPLPAGGGLEAWTAHGAPLPFRLLLLAAPGLGGSDRPARPGWWLRHLTAECVISETLGTAPPEAALALQPGLILALSAG